MMVNWEVVLWTCITVGVLIGIFAIIVYVISATNLKKRRNELVSVHENMKVGSRVMLSGGIFGTVTAVKEDILLIEIAKGVVVEASRYGVQKVD